MILNHPFFVSLIPGFITSCKKPLPFELPVPKQNLSFIIQLSFPYIYTGLILLIIISFCILELIFHPETYV